MQAILSDYPMKSDKYHVWVYMHDQYKYSDKEDMLETLCQTNCGYPTGCGTDLTTGKRDMSFAFPDIHQVKNFLNLPDVKRVIQSYKINRIKI
jgi:hypothetical protein